MEHFAAVSLPLCGCLDFDPDCHRDCARGWLLGFDSRTLSGKDFASDNLGIFLQGTAEHHVGGTSHGCFTDRLNYRFDLSCPKQETTKTEPTHNEEPKYTDPQGKLREASREAVLG